MQQELLIVQLYNYVSHQTSNNKTATSYISNKTSPSVYVQDSRLKDNLIIFYQPPTAYKEYLKENIIFFSVFRVILLSCILYVCLVQTASNSSLSIYDQKKNILHQKIKRKLLLGGCVKVWFGQNCLSFYCLYTLYFILVNNTDTTKQHKKL